jgi:N-acetylglucosaminyldiphosphoundecaprenol N-acetyl-beta-D-mannosaminyltransferase
MIGFMSNYRPPVNILGIRFKPYSKSELFDAMKDAIQSGRRQIVLSGNVHSFNKAFSLPWLHSFYNRADIVRIDGAGLRLGAKILGLDLPGRMTWADLIWDVAAAAEANGWSLFLLGSDPGVAEQAATNLSTRFTELQLPGVYHGYFDPSPTSAANQVVLASIRAQKPDVLIVAMGMPRQEKWIADNLEDIDATVIMTGGAVLDYTSGVLQRAPRWMTRNGLEWLGRMFIEPRRLWQRYIIGNPLFIWRVLCQRLRGTKQDN